MPRQTHRWIALILTSAALAAGCSHQEVLQPSVEVTVGQQLIDLKRALDSGALSAAEYQKQKRHLIDNVR